MRKVFVVFLSVVLFCCGGFLVACKNEPKKTAVEASVYSLPEKTVYLKDEPFDISGGKIQIAYSDGSVSQIDMTSDMYESADTSTYGAKELTLSFTVDGKTFTLKINYKVVFSIASRDFINACNALPLLNNITVDDVDDIIQALDMYEALNDSEKDYVSQNYAALLEKLDRLEQRILPVYIDKAKEDAAEFYELLNVGNYTPENLAAINQKIQAFIGAEYTELKAVVAAEGQMYQEINSVPKRTDDPSYTLEEHKQNTIAALKNMLVFEVYEVESEGILDSDVKKVTIDYSQDTQYQTQVNNVLQPIVQAQSIKDVDDAYANVAKAIRELAFDAFMGTVNENLTNLMTDWKATIQEQLSRWTQDTISLRGQFSGVNTDYMKDNRWWIPAPYRIDNLINSIDKTFEGVASITGLKNLYYEYAYEILRATMQRNVEMYYFIERNLNNYYDTSDVLYWNNIAAYWGASPQQQFIYDGILKDYVGNVYGNSDNNPYRLVSEFYNPNRKGSTIEELVEDYIEVMTRIIPPPKTITSVVIDTLPAKTVYNLGDAFSVEGGAIKVIYSDTSYEIIPMTSSMYDADDVDTSTTGDKTIELTVVIDGQEHKVTLTYSVVMGGAVGTLIEKINALPAAVSTQDLDNVIECVDLYNNLTPEQKEIIDTDYASAVQKMISAQTTLISVYAKPRLTQAQIKWETLNYHNYSQENRALLEQKFDNLKISVLSATTFAQVDELFETYNSEVSQIAQEDVDLETLKQNIKASIERLLEINLYVVQDNGPSSINIVVQTSSLKNHSKLATALQFLYNAINEAEDVDSLLELYDEEILTLYASVLEVYAEEAEANVKALVNALRDTVKEVWEIDGFAGDANLPVDYMANASEYLWWTPEPFMVSTVYSKIKVKQGATKVETFENYNAAYVDMLRCVMYRNLYTVFQYNLRKDPSIEQYRWQIISGFNSSAGGYTYEYDGALEEYKGTIINVEFRLWHWGFKPGEKQTTVAGLVEKYNYDMNHLLLN